MSIENTIRAYGARKQAQADERTIPAETPTADQWKAWAMAYRAHADALAEALREIVCAGMTDSRALAIRKAEDALAAYESDKH